MSEIYLVEDLEWENNSVGNSIRPALIRLQELSTGEAAVLLADLQTLNLNDERPLWEILGLAVPLDTAWKELRIGELKTLLALAVGDEAAIREGCDWIHQYKQMNPRRRLVYRCIESMLSLENVDNSRRALNLLYGAETVRQAEALLDRSERFFGLNSLGPNMEDSRMHQTLLAAYDKLFANPL
jgi:ribosomal protein S12 methylthiotransferase accessory factor